MRFLSREDKYVICKYMEPTAPTYFIRAAGKPNTVGVRPAGLMSVALD